MQLASRSPLVPLVGTREDMLLAREQRAAAARQVRVLFGVVWVPVLAVLAWRMLLSGAEGSLALRTGALGVFTVGVAVAALLVVRRSSSPLLLARIDEVGTATSSTSPTGAGEQLAITLACTDDSGARLVARLELGGGEVAVAPGDWTLLSTNRSGTLVPWRVPAAAAARIGG